VSEPRIHERRVQVARQLGRTRRHRILGGLAVVAFAAAGFALLHSSFLGARHVVVVGEEHTSRQAVIRAAGLAGAPPLVDLDAAVIARRVERLPWVARAAVSLHWPWGVTIRVTDRIPVAAVALGGGRFAICDPTGRVLSDVAGRPSSLPLLSGVSSVPAPGNRLPGDAGELAAVAAAMPESMVGETTGILASPEGVEVAFKSGLVGLIGSTSALGDKFVSLATVITHGGLSGIATVDVRVPAAPVLLRKGSSPIVQGTGGG
jgi:cell division protein FtsQ